MEDQDAREMAIQFLPLDILMSALLRTHHDPAQVLVAAEQQFQSVQATLLTLSWTDNQIAAFDARVSLFLKMLR